MLYIITESNMLMENANVSASFLFALFKRGRNECCIVFGKTWKMQTFQHHFCLHYLNGDAMNAV